MKKKGRLSLRFGFILVMVSVVMAVALSCSSSPTTTPEAPATPKPAVAPTQAATQVTATPITSQPTPAAASPTPTPAKELPTATPTATIHYGGTLNYPGESRSYDNMDPAFSVETGVREAMYGIFDNLVTLGSDGTVQPGIAKSWDISSDGMTITFHLNQGIRFTDGTTLDANAVKWNYDRFLDPSVASPRKLTLVPPLQSVSVIDDSTVQMKLTASSRAFLSLLTQREGSIASPTAVQKMNSYSDHNGAFGGQPVGSGPFTLKKWVPDSEIILQKNPNYWQQGKPYLDEVDFPIVPDKTVEFAMLRTGEIDMMEEMNSDDAVRAKSISGINVVQQSGLRTRFILFKTDKAPWNNLALRQAFAYAMNRPDFVKVIYSGFGQPAYSVMTPAYGKFFDSSIKTYAYNLAMAKQKLAEAGYPNGFTYTQYQRTGGIEDPWAESIQAMLKEVGITANLQPYAYNSYYTDWVAGKYDSPNLAGLSVRADIQEDLDLRWRCGNRYPMAYCNQQVDQLLSQADATYDTSKAQQLYYQIEQIIANDVPSVPLVYEPVFWGLHDYVQGFQEYLDKEARVADIWLSK